MNSLRWPWSVWCALLIAAAVLTVLFVPLDFGENVQAYVCISLVLGTLFGATSIAALLVAVGPMHVLWRLTLSLSTLAILDGALLLHSRVHRESEFEILVIISLVAVAQWLVGQVPSWSLAWWLRLRLRRANEAQGGRSPRQFGIRQLMIFTTVVALMLGIGRYLAINELYRRLLPPGNPMVFLFIAGAVTLVTIPLFIVALRASASWVSLLSSLIFTVIVTAVEYGTFGEQFGPNLTHISLINLFALLWTLLFVLAGRLCGFRFSPHQVAPEVASPVEAR